MTTEIKYGRPGYQLVTIDNKLAYAWTGTEPLKIGDKVEVRSVIFPDGWIGEVTSLGSYWDGHHKEVVKVYERV